MKRGPDPKPAGLRKSRRQVAQGLSREPRFAQAQVRAASAEEFKIPVVTLHAGWRSARREGTLPAYAAGVNGMVRRQAALDLRRLDLTRG